MKAGLAGNPDLWSAEWAPPFQFQAMGGLSLGLPVYLQCWGIYHWLLPPTPPPHLHIFPISHSYGGHNCRAPWCPVIWSLVTHSWELCPCILTPGVSNYPLWAACAAMQPQYFLAFFACSTKNLNTWECSPGKVYSTFEEVLQDETDGFRARTYTKKQLQA